MAKKRTKRKITPKPSKTPKKDAQPVSNAPTAKSHKADDTTTGAGGAGGVSKANVDTRPVSNVDATTRATAKQNAKQTDNTQQTTQLASELGDNEAGGVSTVDPLAEEELPAGLPLACVRPDESRKQSWERIRREARAAGMTRRLAYDYATRKIDELRPLPPIPEPGVEPAEPDPEPEKAQIAPPGSNSADSGQVTGLGEIPEDWPELTANASLQSEVAWVQANRLRIVQGDRVELGLALGPAPSHAALGWLETSIRAYSKWCDIAARATSTQSDEAEHVRRERLSIEDMRALLVEMRPVCPHCGERLA